MRKKIAICAAQVPFVRGGAELHVEELYKNLKRRQYDVEVIQLPYKWYPKDQLLKSIMAWRMIDLSESNGQKIDLVIPTKFPSYAVNHENKVTWLIHQYRGIYDLYGTSYSDFDIDNVFHNKIREQVIEIDNKTLGESKKIFTNAKNTQSRLKKYNGLDSEHLYHPPKHVGNYYNEKYENYILSIGRLDELKRNDLLIKSLKYCDKSIKAIIGGRGPHLDQLKRIAQEYKVEDRVEFLGFVEDDRMLELYANAFAVYFAPVDEDYGYITLEAFLSNKPVITCIDSGGPLEFIEDGVNGFICKPNEQIIGDKINYLFNHKTKCKEYGQNGFDKVKGISWDNVIDRLTETLR